MSDKNVANVATPTLQYRQMEHKWGKILALLGGTDEMRNRGTEFLPQHFAETDKRYKERLQSSVLKNYFKATVKHMTGKVFSKPISVEKAGSQIESLFSNIDRTGNDLSAFCSRVFFRSLAMGLHYILVDHPSVPVGLSLEDERNLEVRPYWASYGAEDVIGIRCNSDGTRIEEARLRETSFEYADNGWGQVIVKRIRVLMPGKFVLWKYMDTTDGGEWIVETEGEMSIDEVPLVPVYTGHRAPFVAFPPLEDLADLNITHWQSYSDQRSILSVARFPMLGVSGYDGGDEKGGQVEIGPFRLLSTTDPQGKFYYVEHGGTAIEAGRKDLEDLKDEMATLGMQLLIPKSNGPTATESAITYSNTSSDLQNMARGLESSIEQALRLTAKWQKQGGSEATVSLKGNFEIPRDTVNEVKELIAMRQSGDISRPTFFKECKRRGFLADDFNAKEEIEILEVEGPRIPSLEED